LVYFFGPKRQAIPSLEEVQDLEPANAVLVLRVGDLGLFEGTWPIIGESPYWQREKWPIPLFIRKDDLSKTARLIEYADNDPSRELLHRKTDYRSTGYEDDGLCGSGSAEIAVTRALS
jgi:hypothetical protein